MKIASWNINSLKVRLSHVVEWLQTANLDVLALQELKLEDSFFPRESFESLGYQGIAVNGQKTYNGVAVISKKPFDAVEMPDMDEQHRIISAVIDGIKIINVYVPNGESVASEKYQYKLKWLRYFIDYVSCELKRYPKMIILGDFNIAPDARDVHDQEQWKEKVLCSSLEREAFQDLLRLGFSDTFRLFEQPAKIYSWWDYRMLSFQRNAGLRIDHILATTNCAGHCLKAEIDKVPRKWERPSDHAPVIAVFDL